MRITLLVLILALPSLAQTTATRLTESQVTAPAVLDPRVSIVLPNGVRAYARIDPATLVLMPALLATDPPTLKAVNATPTPPAAKLTVAVAVYDKALSNGTFTWVGGGEATLVFRNGALLAQGVDYAVETGKIKITTDQGWYSTDRVIVVAQ